MLDASNFTVEVVGPFFSLGCGKKAKIYLFRRFVMSQVTWFVY